MPRTKARKYQKDGIRRIEQWGLRALIADEMGLGKTFTSLKVLQRNKRFTLPALVICPAPLKWNWCEEAAKHIGMAAEVLEGTKPPRRANWRDPSLLIINYEILTPWMDYLLDLDPQLIIVDEAHRCKSRTTQCTKNVQKLARYTPHLLHLTGTPITNEPSELFTLVNMLWPEHFNSFFSFAQRYTNAQMKPWGWQYKGAKNLLELHGRLKEYGMLRRTVAQVLHELPPKTITVLPIPLTRPKMREYRKAKDSFLDWLAKKSKAKAMKARKAQRLVKIGYLKRLAAELKLDDAKKWIDNYLNGTDEKLIVFGVHHSILQPLYQRYKGQSVLIDGNVKGKKRHNRVLEFRRSPNKQIAFCNIKAGGIGLNMPEATNVAFVELPWTPAELSQAIARAHRMGQTRGVMVHLLVAKDTIEERLCQVLQDKAQIANAVVDGGDDDNNRLSIFDQLEKELLNEV